MTDNTSVVRELLELFGVPEKKRNVKKLAEKKPELFEKLVSQAGQYASPTSQRKTGRIFLIVKGKVIPLIKYGSLSVVQEVGKPLYSKINKLALENDITGRAEHKLYRVIKEKYLTTMTFESILETPVSFARCVFMDPEKSEAISVFKNGMEEIKSQFGITALLCNEWKFPKNDSSSEGKKLFLLEERTKSTLSLIHQFLSDSPPTKEKKPKKAKKPTGITEKVPDLIQSYLPPMNTIIDNPNLPTNLFTILDRDTTNYAKGLEWFLSCPAEMEKLYCF